MLFHLRRLGLPSLPCDACVNPCLNKRVAANDQGSLARQGGEKSLNLSVSESFNKKNMRIEKGFFDFTSIKMKRFIGDK